MNLELGTARSERHGLYRDARQVWRVAPAQPERRPWWKRLLRRKPEPTAYHRCLAVHLHFASKTGGLS